MTRRLMNWLTPGLALALTACAPQGASNPLGISMTRDATSLGIVDAEIDTQVDQLWVTVDAIEVQAADGGLWHPLDVDPIRINLASLPTDGDSIDFQVLGDLEPGKYTDIRLFTSNERIVFAEDVWLSRDAKYDAFTVYTVLIPGEAQTGIHTHKGFIHPPGGSQVEVVFDEDLTYDQLGTADNQPTPLTGSVIAPMVLRVEQDLPSVDDRGGDPIY